MAKNPSNARRKKTFARALVAGRSLLLEIFSDAAAESDTTCQAEICFHVHENGHVRVYAEGSEMGARAKRLYDGVNAITQSDDETGRVLLELYRQDYPQSFPLIEEQQSRLWRIMFKPELASP